MTNVTAETTRDRLLRAAESLYAEHGIDAVSLREIGRTAGAKNVLAVQYWFESRDGLVRAIIEHHRSGIELRRHAMLDVYESSERDDPRALAEALVIPFATKLDEGVSGAGYLRVLADLLTSPRPDPASWDAELPSSSMARWRDLLRPHLDPEAVVLHRRFHTLRFVVAELALRARSCRSDHELFVSQLVDAVDGLLAAPVSPATRRLLERRGSRETPSPA